MTATSIQSKIYLHLDASDTTLIHRAGILGLWMTLKQLEKRFPHPSQRLGKLSWELTPNSISLDWEGQDKAVLDWLLKQAFQIDERGLISLTGLDPQSMSLINRVHLQEVLSQTLLQYNKNLTSIASQYKGLGINIEKIAPYLFLEILITLSIPWQFYLLLKVNANDANHSVNFNKFSGNVNPIQPSLPSVFVGKFAISSKNKESQFTKNGMKFKEFVSHKIRVTMPRIILMMM
ncbi:type I-MYXAN CRISPR-associated Cas8a1/Cmx1 [Limnoraphis robusta]|uniref:type I-MYXAN CRISPR-associated Cas8a1/Cmx1 n=1 Tax=Limnoraphis robusta TaxID=1118279 RepID=UPI00066CBDDD|nr:type I-MYXAN CRISPR-associated Cas8a1/Cmx1 [Limnoraphis robusta]